MNKPDLVRIDGKDRPCKVFTYGCYPKEYGWKWEGETRIDDKDYRVWTHGYKRPDSGISWYLWDVAWFTEPTSPREQAMNEKEIDETVLDDGVRDFFMSILGIDKEECFRVFPLDKKTLWGTIFFHRLTDNPKAKQRLINSLSEDQVKSLRELFGNDKR